MQKLTQKNNKELFLKHKSLSIQFSLDGFSFCIKDIPTGEIFMLSEYSFDTSLETPGILLEKIKSIFETEKELQVDFESITAIHQNQLATQVPNDFFDENHLKSYLDYTIKTLPSDYVTHDDLELIKAKNIYIPYVNINNFLFQNFGEFEFKHHLTVLINNLLEYNFNKKETIFVNVTYSSLDIVVITDNQLSFCNSFTFNTKEDFLYYILFSCEQLNLDPKTLQLAFLGNITTEFETFKITSEYIKNIDFIESDNEFLKSSEHFFTHSNYTLIS